MEAKLHKGECLAIRNGWPNYVHPATLLLRQECRSGLLDNPAVLEASSTLHPQPIPPCWGRVVSALGTSRPFPVWPRVVASIEPTPWAGVLKVSASRSLHDWRASRCPRLQQYPGSVSVSAGELIGENFILCVKTERAGCEMELAYDPRVMV